MVSFVFYESAMLAKNASNTSERTIEIPAPYAEWTKSTVNESLVGIMCALSIIGSVIIMVSYVFWKDLRTTSRKILLYLSISDLLIAISNLLGILVPMHDNVKHPHNLKCVTQSFVTTSASITSFLWTASLAIYLYLAIVKNNQALGRKFLPLFHIVNWSFGPVLNGIAIHYGMLGYAENPITGGWCWIYHNQSMDTNGTFQISDKEKLWILIDGKGIEIIVYTSIFVLYGIIKYKLHKELNDQRKGPMQPEVLKSAKMADRKLIFVPLLLFFGRFWGILRFFINFTTVQKRSYSLTTSQKVLFTLEGVGDSSQGFLNCILFCFLSPKVFSHIKEAFLPVCCRQRKRSAVDAGPHSEANRASLNGNGQHCLSMPESTGDDKQPLLRANMQAGRYASQCKEK